MRTISTDVIVIGAGVVGLAIAERLVDEGREVVLIDPNPPGSGASYGNAGTIAEYAVQPVGTPGVLKSLPSLLFSKTSPLAVHPSARLALAPWLGRFLLQSLPSAARRNAQALAPLLNGAAARWQALAERIGGIDLIEQRGCLYLYDNPAAARAAETDLEFRKALGVKLSVLTEAELAHLEPGLPRFAGGAAWFQDAQFLTDPGLMLSLLAEKTVEHAGLLRARADRISRQFDGTVVEGEGFRARAKLVIVAAGAHSRALAASAGDAVPLDTERGYHVEWDMAEPPIARPSCPVAQGFYLCPMAGRLRAAGTVELGGLTAGPSLHRVARLVEGARSIFPWLPEPDRSWMGLRPSMPDSLPVIGESRGGPDVIHAFGHGHIGLTLAPITAEIVADLAMGRPPALDLTPYRPGRFRRR
jgi:D-amino-acid dehydrogenase